jgi:hypothetical protein
MIRFTEKLQVVPLRAPISSSDGFNSAFVKVQNNHWITFLVQWGALDNGTTSEMTFRPFSTTNVAGSTNAADVGLPFSYRLMAGAIGSDEWGAITAVSSTGGYVLTQRRTQTNRALLIDVDPSVIPGLDANATHVYLSCANNADAATDAAMIHSIVAILEPRYPQNVNLSST